MIIIDVNHELPIGKIITIPVLSDDNCINRFNVRAFISKEVTKQDYIEFCKKENALILNPERLDFPGTKFYEISID